MKIQTKTHKMTQLAVLALSCLMVMTSACSKKNSDAAPPPPPPPVAPNCSLQPCIGGVAVGGQVLYGGPTSNGVNTQAQFQVFGDPSGTGDGSIVGTVNFTGYICQVGMQNLNGAFSIQMTQKGNLYADVFTGSVNLVGPQGTFPAAIQVIPSRTQNAGLITIWIWTCGSASSMNF